MMWHMKGKAVLFDLDGTLVDTIQDIALAMNTVLENHGFPQHEPEEYKMMVGWGTRELAVRALPSEAQSPRLIDECAREMIRLYNENPVVHTKPYPHVPELVCALSERNVIKGILTNKTDEIAHLVVKKLFDYEQFTIIQGAKPDMPTKPHPAAAIKLAEVMGYNPEEILYVGDSAVDVETAKRAGMIPVAVSWGFRLPEELLEAGAEILIHDPLDLLAYVSI